MKSRKERLYSQTNKYLPNCDFDRINKAIEMATKAHANQKRKSGEPYAIHPLEVAIMLAEMEMDEATIIAGLLHDVAEDTEITLEMIKNEFGQEIADLVDGVTKLGRIQYTSKE